MKKEIFFLFFAFCFKFSFAGQADKNDSLPTKFGTRITVAEMMARLPNLKGDWFELGMHHGTLDVLLYAPKEKDPQTPHLQDEVYVVVSGSGIFFDGKNRYPFGKGDVLFVPAKTEHKFEKFSKDFATWVIFYGPEGGEKNN